MSQTPFPLDIFAGPTAFKRLQENGWNSDLFGLLLGASGGPKWLSLCQLDMALNETLLGQLKAPIVALGSSIGCWRHAYLAQANPRAAMEAFLDPYINQTYETKPTTREVSEVTRTMLDDLLGREGKASILEERRLKTRIVTARAPAKVSPAHPVRVGTHMLAAATGNAFSRNQLQKRFQRVVFHSGAAPEEMLPLAGFNTLAVPLTEGTIAPAIHASSSIPAVLTGESSINGAPEGHYWDGGIIDYHFDLRAYSGEKLVLYPHFTQTITPGWFDKMHKRRHLDPRHIDKLVLIAPSQRYIAKLPHGKIPDRSDFSKFSTDMRQRYWHTVVERGTQLAEAWLKVVNDPNPVRYVERYCS